MFFVDDVPSRRTDFAQSGLGLSQFLPQVLDLLSHALLGLPSGHTVGAGDATMTAARTGTSAITLENEKREGRKLFGTRLRFTAGRGEEENGNTNLGPFAPTCVASYPRDKLASFAIPGGGRCREVGGWCFHGLVYVCIYM